MIDQKKILLDYLQTNGTITAYQAMTDLGIGRLASRIYELRSEGHNITMEIRSARNRYGKTVSFGVYRLEASAGES